MNTWVDALRRPVTRIEIASWALAVLAVGSVFGAGAILLDRPAEAAGQAAMAEPAIMIELAPEAMAQDVSKTEISEDRADAAEQPLAKSKPAAEAPLPQQQALADRMAEPEPSDHAVASMKPVEDTRQPEKPLDEMANMPDPLETAMLAALDNVEVPLPIARPRPPAKKQVEARKVRPVTPSVATRKAAAEVRRADRTAARETTAALPKPPSAEGQRWKARVSAHLERRKRFPAGARARGEQGTVLVLFRIDDGGRVLTASLARSSGHGELDRAALAMVQQASPVPAPPAGVSRTITAPVRFSR